MSCNSKLPEMVKMSASQSPPAVAGGVGSDAFGNGCKSACGFPMDCGANYPGFKYYADTTMAGCLFQPPFAVSSLPMQLCQTCETNLSAAYDNMPVPTMTLYTPTKAPPSPRPSFVYKAPNSCQ